MERISFEEQARLLRTKGEFYIGRFVCRKCGKMYEYASVFSSRRKECICGGELEEIWATPSQWRHVLRTGKDLNISKKK